MAINLGSLLWKGEGFLEGQRPNHSLILQVNVWGRAWRHWRGQKDAHPAPSCSVPFSQAKGVTSHQGSPSLPRAQSSCNCRCDAQVENSQNSTVLQGPQKTLRLTKSIFPGTPLDNMAKGLLCYSLRTSEISLARESYRGGFEYATEHPVFCISYSHSISLFLKLLNFSYFS